MFRDFRNRAEFYVVYIAEAHPVDGWQMASNEAEGIRILQAVSFAERLAAARRCADALGLSIPTLVDEMDDAAMRGFSAWPERIYIIDASGKVHYRGGQGPFDFKPDEARSVLSTLFEGQVPDTPSA